MKRILLAALAFLIVMAAWATLPARAATFPIDYSDPSSDVVKLNATTGLCVVDTGGNCVKSPDPHDVNIQWVRGRDAGTSYNLTIQVQGRIEDHANTSYVVNLYTDATNQTHWIVNYTNGGLSLFTNRSGASRVDISGNATLWGPSPTQRDSVSMFVNKTLLGGPSNITASVNIDATAIMRGDPAAGRLYSYQDFGWEVPGHPGTSPTLLRGHVYAGATTTPLAGATVTLSSGQTATTNATGYYEFSLTAGTYNVTFRASGYITVSVSVTLTTGQTVTRDIQLAKEPGLSDFLLPVLLLAAILVVLGVLLVVRRRRKGSAPR